MKKLHVSVFRLIRELHPKAPRVGTRQKVFLGVTRTDGRDHHCVVRGDNDPPRACKVIGYRIELGYAVGGWPLDETSSNVIARVRMAEPVPLHADRILDVHISCLECVPSDVG